MVGREPGRCPRKIQYLVVVLGRLIASIIRLADRCSAHVGQALCIKTNDTLCAVRA